MKSGRSRGKDVVVQGTILEWTHLQKQKFQYCSLYFSKTNNISYPSSSKEKPKMPSLTNDLLTKNNYELEVTNTQKCKAFI